MGLERNVEGYPSWIFCFWTRLALHSQVESSETETMGSLSRVAHDSRAPLRGHWEGNRSLWQTVPAHPLGSYAVLPRQGAHTPYSRPATQVRVPLEGIHSIQYPIHPGQLPMMCSTPVPLASLD